jgi:hypothetical protein
MRMRLFSTIFGMAVLAMMGIPANAQVTEQAAREQARNIVRSELHSRLNFKADQFLSVQRDETLEQSLAVAVGKRTNQEFIYKVSPEGVEVRENDIVYHTWTDTDFIFIVGVSSTDGSAYRIHDFGLAESLAEFERLMTALGVHVGRADQAESIADFYRNVNPENYEGLTPISSLIELKQAAERQCQVVPFDPDEKEFEAWWKHAKPLYEELPFKQTAARNGGGYAVEWIVLSSAAKGNCGGAPLRVRLEISSDGHVGKITFSPAPKG